MRSTRMSKNMPLVRESQKAESMSQKKSKLVKMSQKLSKIVKVIRKAKILKPKQTLSPNNLQ